MDFASSVDPASGLAPIVDGQVTELSHEEYPTVLNFSREAHKVCGAGKKCSKLISDDVHITKTQYIAYFSSFKTSHYHSSCFFLFMLPRARAYTISHPRQIKGYSTLSPSQQATMVAGLAAAGASQSAKLQGTADKKARKIERAAAKVLKAAVKALKAAEKAARDAKKIAASTGPASSPESKEAEAEPEQSPQASPTSVLSKAQKGKSATKWNKKATAAAPVTADAEAVEAEADVTPPKKKKAKVHKTETPSKTPSARFLRSERRKRL